MDEILMKPSRNSRRNLTAGRRRWCCWVCWTKRTSPMYGYQIAKLIEAQTKDVDIMKQGALYPVLRSLESTGLLESEVEPSVSGPPRRYYKITDSGRKTLAKWIEIWHQTREFVDAVLKGGDDD